MRSRPAPAILRQGFRVFFPAAGLFAAAAVALWLAAFLGYLRIPTAFGPLAWHAHEMIFGFVPAAVAGFLLTAIPNWTRRHPVQGLPLASLFAVWLAGRAAVATSALVGTTLAAILDLAFLAALVGIAIREIVAVRNWRNLPIMAIVAMLFPANLLTHLDAEGVSSTGALGQRLGIAVIVLLISMIGGRITPSFTRNWLQLRGAARLPVGHGVLDGAAIASLIAALVIWVAVPEMRAGGIVLIVAAVLLLLRLARWEGRQTLSEPLLWSLHLAYAWIPVGLLLLGASLFLPSLPASAGVHALTAGAIGSMTLAVMTRATLGHSGRPLAADRWTLAIYLCVSAAAVLRVAAPILAERYLALLVASACAWIAAFGIFAWRYGRLALSNDASGAAA